MNFIQDCFEEHASKLIGKLEAAGFSINQVIDFLPEAATAIASSCQKSAVAQSIDKSLCDDSANLINSINMDAMVKKSGVSRNLVISGFKIITPFFSQSYAKKSTVKLR